MAAITFPLNPANGAVYTAGNGIRYQYVEAKRSWTTTLSGAAATLTANPGSSPPSGADFGTFWMDTESNSLYVWVNNSGTGEWRKVAGGSTGDTGTGTSGLALEGTAIYDGTVVLSDLGIFLETTSE
tara:strand:+ start:701 stop:1081 length:381 start_codon:yes stop_codon:yes gene_type:complete